MGLVRFPPSMLPILVDASFLVSIYDKREPHHKRCMEALDRVNRPLVTCEPAVTEAIHLLRRIPEAPQAILENLEQGLLEIPFALAGAARAAGALMRKYADAPCDFADACLVLLAEQVGCGDILTLDTDFKRYRWRRNRAFNLLIPLD
jgi:uncharacterized protein